MAVLVVTYFTCLKHTAFARLRIRLNVIWLTKHLVIISMHFAL